MALVSFNQPSSGFLGNQPAIRVWLCRSLSLRLLVLGAKSDSPKFSLDCSSHLAGPAQFSNAPFAGHRLRFDFWNYPAFRRSQSRLAPGKLGVGAGHNHFNPPSLALLRSVVPAAPNKDLPPHTCFLFPALVFSCQCPVA